MRRPPSAFLAAALAIALTARSSGSSSSKATTTTASAGTSGSTVAMPSWPAPNDPMARARAAKLVPETAESLAHHVHSHLDVFVDGRALTVPAGIGIDIENPGVHTFGSGNDVSYGGTSKPCSTPCISPLHTLDTTGIIHTESATTENNTLGELFTEWGVRFDGTCVGDFCTPDVPVVV